MLDITEFHKQYKYHLATPMMQQYLDIKFEHQNALVLFRMGDFYEMFFGDAVTASKVLGLALAKRGKHGEEDLQMAGVPYHALESYLHKLVEEGHIVAICEQLESPEEAKKRGYKSVVKRDVMRIITPGTITEESILQTDSPNYLISIRIAEQNAAISYLDISTAEFNVALVDVENLVTEIAKLAPKEIIISEKDANNYHLQQILAPYRNILVTQVESYFASSKCQKTIEKFYNIHSYTAIGSLNAAQVSAIGAILEYVNITQKHNLPNLPLPHIVNISDFMVMDSSTRRNLEIAQVVSGGTKGSLFSVINHTLTKAGSRLLYSFLSSPLANLEQINHRLGITEFFHLNIKTTEKLRDILKEMGDIERIITRISMKRFIPRDLLSILGSLEAARKLRDCALSDVGADLPAQVKVIFDALVGFSGIAKDIEKIIKPDAPNSLSDGGFIHKNYHPKLAELYNLLDNNSDVINQLKLEYQRETGVDTLKICHNNILGLFIEVTPKHVHKVTGSEFIHRQTIASAVRFTTERLKVLEADMVSAQSLAIALEQEIFWKLCDEIIGIAASLRSLAHNVSTLDVFCSFAHLAYENDYTKPEIEDSSNFLIHSGRHAVVERSMSHGKFIPNNCDLGNSQRLWLLTGPNMAGKSTFLRQNALIIILAQIGSFVPAISAQIGVVDRLFSRIGASDNLAKGQSTFMVEMLETATILAQSTPRSFIILDEIGRGTSTYDGVSIAWACLEHIHDKLKCRSLFATHYHELTSLTDALPGLKNYTMNIREENGEVLFLHQIIPGTADKSYGIHVAGLAGLPASVIKRAYEVLRKLEKTAKTQSKSTDTLISNNYSLFETAPVPKAPSRIDQAMLDINPDDFSPKEALEKLYELKKISFFEKK